MFYNSWARRAWNWRGKAKVPQASRAACARQGVDLGGFYGWEDSTFIDDMEKPSKTVFRTDGSSALHCQRLQTSRMLELIYLQIRGCGIGSVEYNFNRDFVTGSASRHTDSIIQGTTMIGYGIENFLQGLTQVQDNYGDVETVPICSRVPRTALIR